MAAEGWCATLTERGTAGAGGPQVDGVPHVHRFRKLWMDVHDWRRYPPWSNHNPTHPLTPPPMIHGSMVATGAKLLPHWTKSRLGGRPACWTLAKAKPKNRPMSGAGDSRRDPDEPQAAVEEERINEHRPQRDAMLTAVPRAGAWQGVVLLPQRQPGAYSAQAVEAVEANEVSDDELETEYQEAVALMTIVKQGNLACPLETTRPSSASSGRNFYVYNGDKTGHWKDGHHCLAEVKRVNWAGGCSKVGGRAWLCVRVALLGKT